MSAPVASTASRAQSTPGPTPSAGTYLALGDSLAVGVGATRPAELGYVARIGASIAPASTVNIAISGETSASFIAGGQLAIALDRIARSEPPVTVVTLDIGGNDLLRLLWTEPCASAPGTAGCREIVASTLAEISANYRDIVSAVRGALDVRVSRARLIAMTYFNPFSGTDALHEASAEIALLGADGRIDCEAPAAANRGMNDIISCVGVELGATVVDVHPAFEGLGLELTHIGSDDIHANDLGYQVIADAFLEVLADAR